MIEFIKRLFGLRQHQWPDGEPAMLADGTRYGTRLANGTIVLAPGFSFEPDPPRFVPLRDHIKDQIDGEGRRA